jgi:HSP20 family molecular chaperone IbpA
MLVRTRPFHPVFDQSADRVFGQLSRSFFAPSRRTPTIDASWTDGSLVLTTDLPGTPAEAVEVSVGGRTLTIAVKTDQLEWERSLRLGAALDPEQVSARYLDGRLTVTIAPVAAVEPRRIDVSTEAPAIESPTAGDQSETPTGENA